MMTQAPRFISIDPEESNLKEVHNLLLGGITPRPIALVSTISEDGINNVAPFSFFNAFGANPPYLAFSPAFSGRDGSPKDTLLNIEATKECVVHAVPYSMIQQASLASTAYSSEVDEFIKAGFEMLDSDLVRPKRVKASPFHMECLVDQIVALGGTKGSGNLVICRVVKFHLDESIMENGIIDPQKIDLVGRNSGSSYTRASGSAIFELDKPGGIGIGIDQLPAHIRNSEVLSANNLGQLGGLTALPTPSGIQQFLGFMMVPSGNNQEFEKTYSDGYKLLKTDRPAGITLIEESAKQALTLNDTDFAIHALLSITL